MATVKHVSRKERRRPTTTQSFSYPNLCSFFCLVFFQRALYLGCQLVARESRRLLDAQQQKHDTKPQKQLLRQRQRWQQQWQRRDADGNHS